MTYKIIGYAALIPVGVFGLGSCLFLSATFSNEAVDGYDPLTYPLKSNILFGLGIGFGITPPLLLAHAILSQ
jgi:hypothetical protein